MPNMWKLAPDPDDIGVAGEWFAPALDDQKLPTPLTVRAPRIWHASLEKWPKDGACSLYVVLALPWA